MESLNGCNQKSITLPYLFVFPSPKNELKLPSTFKFLPAQDKQNWIYNREYRMPTSHFWSLFRTAKKIFRVFGKNQIAVLNYLAKMLNVKDRKTNIYSAFWPTNETIGNALDLLPKKVGQIINTLIEKSVLVRFRNNKGSATALHPDFIEALEEGEREQLYLPSKLEAKLNALKDEMGIPDSQNGDTKNPEMGIQDSQEKPNVTDEMGIKYNTGNRKSFNKSELNIKPPGEPKPEKPKPKINSSRKTKDYKLYNFLTQVFDTLWGKDCLNLFPDWKAINPTAKAIVNNLDENDVLEKTDRLIDLVKQIARRLNRKDVKRYQFDPRMVLAHYGLRDQIKAVVAEIEANRIESGGPQSPSTNVPKNHHNHNSCGY